MARPTDVKINFLAWYKEVFGFSDEAARALYDDQLLRSKTTLSELTDQTIDNIVKAIRRTLNIAEISVERLKLAVFWIKHMDRVQRDVGIPARPLVKTELKEMLLLKTQKQLEDDWRLSNKEPDYSTQTLDMASAAKTFDKTKTLLSRVRGVTGVPLSYVIRGKIKVEHETDEPEFGATDSKFTSIDEEMIARAPILSEDADENDPDESLETKGPFHVAFLTDAKKVYVILHAQYSTAGAWQHVKKYSTTQNGRQVWRTLHTFFFGKDRVNTMYSEIIGNLKILTYKGDLKNWNFDKYCTSHVEQHNRLAALQEYGVQGIDENMKIHYFEEGIKDESLSAAKTMILADRTKFQDFTTVMNLYSNLKRTQKNDNPPTGRTISALTQGRGGGGRGRGGTGRGRGRGRGGMPRAFGLVPQEEIDKVTGIEDKRYPTDVYLAFTPAQKAKHWQLKNPDQTPGTGPAKSNRRDTTGLNSQIAELKTAMSTAATAISEFTATTKRAADDDQSDLTKDSGWGRPRDGNRDNPALARQETCPKKPKT